MPTVQEYKDALDSAGVEYDSGANKDTLVKLADDNGVSVGEDAGDRLPYYCPGCGREYAYPAECVGRSLESPHQPIQTVSTDELSSGDTEDHTPAPSTGV